MVHASRFFLTRPGVALVAVTLCGCGRHDPIAAERPAESTIRFAPVAIGEKGGERPWITHLAVMDLDGDNRLDVVACDAETDTIRWLRQVGPGSFEERTLATVRGPAHVEPCDLDRDGDLDLLVASMGRILPTNDPLGAVVVLENRGAEGFVAHTLLDQVARVTDVRGADLDGDGDIDLVVGQFGYVSGEVRILRNRDGRFDSEILLGLSGTIHTPIGDLNGDGRLDIAALVSQEWEEIHLFENLPSGIRNRVVWGSTNEDFGSSGLAMVDLDRDGDLDLVVTNGDAFDYGRPGGRSWHGLQWLENRNGVFRYHRIGSFAGAFSPVATDLDNDGDLDLATVSGFNDWTDPAAVSLQAWINDGHQSFQPVVLAHQPTHLMALAAGDLDGDGRVDLVTGGLHAYPPDGVVSRITWWRGQ